MATVHNKLPKTVKRLMALMPDQSRVSVFKHMMIDAEKSFQAARNRRATDIDLNKTGND